MQKAVRGGVVAFLVAAMLAMMGQNAPADARRAGRGVSSVLQCVVYARSVSEVHIRGNAHTWWDQAAGAYARGHTPAPGSVMVFKRSGSMRLGHVSVVRQVRGAREIIVDHANWAGTRARRGIIDRGISIIDISENNDWSMVRVWYPPAGNYGRGYPVYGFIHPRSAPPRETLMMTAGAGAGAEDIEVAMAPPERPVRAAETALPTGFPLPPMRRDYVAPADGSDAQPEASGAASVAGTGDAPQRVAPRSERPSWLADTPSTLLVVEGPARQIQ